jgi:hypothetical protein
MAAIGVPATATLAAPAPLPTAPTSNGVQSVQRIDDKAGASMTSVSCWDYLSGKGCVAGDGLGNVVYYDGITWAKPVSIFTADDGGVSGVSCPISTFCMAVSPQGGYSTTTDSGATWSGSSEIVSSDGKVSLGGEGVSCLTPSYCMAESSTEVLTDAAGAPIQTMAVWHSGKWSFEPTPSAMGAGNSSNPVSCAGPKLCAFVDDADNATTYNGKSWSSVHVLNSDFTTTEVSCSVEPVSWSPVGHGYEPVRTEPVCTAVDWNGYAFTFNGRNWTSGSLVDTVSSLETPSLVGVSCVLALCAAVDATHHVVYESILTAAAGTWGAPYRMYSNPTTDGEPTAISCGDNRFCVAVTSNGYAVLLDP